MPGRRIKPDPSVIDVDTPENLEELFDTPTRSRLVTPIFNQDYLAENQEPPGSSDTVADDSDMGPRATRAHASSTNGQVTHDPPNDQTNGVAENQNAEVTQQSTHPEAMDALAEDSRQLIKTIQKLEALNIDNTLPSLPKFIVVGDQSAGKSSIIEAICDVQLPRGSGTCTRCPFQITTASTADGAWSCTVSLSKKYFYSPGEKGSIYQDWTEQDMTVHEFATITDKASLEHALAQAQLAILNPGQNHENFQTAVPAPKGKARGKKSEPKFAVEFSPNIVSLEIQGPGLPELSFYDLPGVITVHDTNDNLVKFVQTLTDEHLQDEKTFVLLAVALDQEVNNSTAFRAVKESGAKDRCMGVLTKPDLLTSGNWRGVEDMLKGKSFDIGKSWYVTKQSPSSGPITHAEARNLENDYFAQPPWTTQLSDFRSRFGVANLQRIISHELTEHIKHDLPEIRRRVENQLNKVTHELSQFPDKPHSAALTVMSIIDQFVATLKADFDDDGAFIYHYKALLQRMNDHLAAASPHIVLRTPGYVNPSVVIESDEDESEEATPAGKKAKTNNGTPVRVPQRPSTTTPQRNRAQPVKTEETAEFKPTPLVIRLDVAAREFERRSNSRVPGTTNPKARDFFITLSLKSWQLIKDDLLEHLSILLQTRIRGLVKKVLNQYLQTELHSQITTTAEDYADKLQKDVTHHINFLIDSEKHRPISHTDSFIAKVYSDRKDELKKNRLRERLNELFDTMAATDLKVPLLKDRKTEKLDEFAKKYELPADDYNQIIESLASVLAYYDNSSRSLMDNVAKFLEFGLVNKFPKELTDHLRQKLRVTDEEACVKLLAENSTREKQRAELQVEKQKLEVALAELIKLGGTASF